MEKFERLKSAYDYLRNSGKVHTQKDVALAMGKKQSDVSRAFKGNPRFLTDGFIKKFNETFDSMFDEDYLMEGIGELLNDKSNDRPKKSLKSGRPYYNTEYKMGYNLPFDTHSSNPDYLIDFTPYNNCDFWCNASGDSMFPTIASGDVVAFKEIKDFRYLLNNEVYGVELNNGLRTIKRVKDKGDDFILIPDNKSYDEQIVPKTEVRRVFKVMGAVKMF